MEKRFNYAGFNLSDNEEAEQWIHDSVTKINFGFWDFNKLCDLLNEQDQKIKDLEEIVKSNNQKLIDKYFEELKELDEEYNTDLDVRLKEIEKLKQENKQLKQTQNSKAIEVLTDILVNLCSKYFTIFDNHDEPIRVLTVEQISSFINNQIKELGGKNG